MKEWTDECKEAVNFFFFFFQKANKFYFETKQFARWRVDRLLLLGVYVCDLDIRQSESGSLRDLVLAKMNY